MYHIKLVVVALGALLMVSTVYAKCGGSVMDTATDKVKQVVSQEVNSSVEEGKKSVKDKAKEMMQGKCGVGKCG